MKLIYSWLTIVGLLLVIGLGSALYEKAQSTVGITAPDGFAVLCTSTNIRMVPHHCVYTAANIGTLTPLILDNTCRTFGSFGSNVRAVDIAKDIVIFSNNAVALRTMAVSFFIENTCVVASGVQMAISAREEVASVGNVIFEDFSPGGIYPVTLGQTNLWYKGVASNCASCTAGFAVTGYYD